MVRIVWYISCIVAIVFHFVYKYKLLFLPEKQKKISKFLYFAVSSLPFVLLLIYYTYRMLQ